MYYTRVRGPRPLMARVRCKMYQLRKRGKLLRIIMIVFLLLGTSCSKSWNTKYTVHYSHAVPSTSASLSGVIDEYLGGSSAGVKVLLRRNRHLVMRAVTNLDGEFKFENIPPGDNYSLAIESRCVSPEITIIKSIHLKAGDTISIEIVEPKGQCDPINVSSMHLTKPFSGRGVALVQVRGVLLYPRPWPASADGTR
jgi:hypothetical protein